MVSDSACSGSRRRHGWIFGSAKSTCEGQAHGPSSDPASARARDGPFLGPCGTLRDPPLNIRVRGRFPSGKVAQFLFLARIVKPACSDKSFASLAGHAFLETAARQAIISGFKREMNSASERPAREPARNSESSYRLTKPIPILATATHLIPGECSSPRERAASMRRKVPFFATPCPQPPHDFLPIDREPRATLRLSMIGKRKLRGRCCHAIAGGEPSTDPWPCPHSRGGEGFLGFVNSVMPCETTTPREPPAGGSRGFFYRPRLTCERLAANRIEPCVNQTEKPEQLKKGPIHEPVKTAELDAARERAR